MSIFNTILEKIGLKKPEAAKTTTAAPAPTKSASPAPKPSSAAPMDAATAAKYTAAASAKVAEARAAAKPAAIEVVDVVSKLELMAKENKEQLNWKVSIVDLLKLLGIDSSLEARKALATELGCPADAMADSARMNTWLHKTVLQKIAENGGNIPQNLLS